MELKFQKLEYHVRKTPFLTAFTHPHYLPSKKKNSYHTLYFACLSNSFIQGIGKGNYSNKASSGVGHVAEASCTEFRPRFSRGYRTWSWAAVKKVRP